MSLMTALVAVLACLAVIFSAAAPAAAGSRRDCSPKGGVDGGVCLDVAADYDELDSHVELLQIDLQQQRRVAAIATDAHGGGEARGGAAAAAVDKRAGADASGHAAAEVVQVQIPGLSNILDAGRGLLNDTANTLTDSIANVAGQVNNATGSVATAAATAVAVALNQTLLVVGMQADLMVNASKSAKGTLQEQMNRTGLTLREKVQSLEDNATFAVQSAMPLWTEVSSAVRSSSAVVTSSLGAVGLSDLGAALDKRLSSSLTEADKVAVSLENISGLLRNVSGLGEDEIRQRLDSVQDGLENGMRVADSFARTLSITFADFTDEVAEKIAKTVPGANAVEIDRVLDTVDGTVADVTGKLIEAPETLLSAVAEATDDVQASLPGGKSDARRLSKSAVVLLLSASFAASCA